mmetsp:Transcript_55336/g.91967  ORF Transcript_55336/g.91967 Transcript_55336/m.91967 type:complete len:136 (-) Transcript_55336:634-1041(-)
MKIPEDMEEKRPSREEMKNREEEEEKMSIEVGTLTLKSKTGPDLMKTLTEARSLTEARRTLSEDNKAPSEEMAKDRDMAREGDGLMSPTRSSGKNADVNETMLLMAPTSGTVLPLLLPSTSEFSVRSVSLRRNAM